MRSLKMKHKNFKRFDGDTVVYEVMYGRWRYGQAKYDSEHDT